MDRRKFIAGAVAAPTVLLASPAIVTAAPLVEWRMQTAFSPFSLAHASAQKFADKVRQKTGGQFDISVFSAGELVAASELLNAVRGGPLQCAQLVLGDYYEAEDKALIFGSGVPFGLTPAQHYSWWREHGGKIVNRVLARTGLMAIPCGDFGQQTGGWYNRRVRRPADLDGLKIRATSLGADIMDRLGMSVTELSAAEIYAALAVGIIDAADHVNFHDDTLLGLDEVAGHCYRHAWWETNAMVQLVVNREEWQDLPAAYRTAIKQACAAAHARLLGQYNRANRTALQNVKAQGEVAVRDYPSSILKAARKASNAEMKEIAAGNADFRRAWRSLKAYKATLSAG